MVSEELVWEKLDEIRDEMFVKQLRMSYGDPQAGIPLSVVEVGLIESIELNGNDVRVLFMPYSRGYVQITRVMSPIRGKLLEIDGIENVTVECIWEPEWTPDRLSPIARTVLGFRDGDAPEGAMHVRLQRKADVHALPFDERTLDRTPFIITADSWHLIDNQPQDQLSAWRGGWKYFTRFQIKERAGISRNSEPVHLDVRFAAGQIRDPAAEIRLIDGSSGEEMARQVYDVCVDAVETRCNVLFFASARAGDSRDYVLLCGNDSPCCWAPVYRTDMMVWGEGYALEIENNYYIARLSPVMGHLRELHLKRWGETIMRAMPDPTPINVLDASNDNNNMLDLAWHGEDYCIHWCPDFMNQLRYRVTNWPEPPNWEITRGPLCTIVRRWGYPVCPLYPALPQSAVSIEVTYIFYNGLPYFAMSTRFDVEEEVDITYVRNDQWLLGGVFTDMFHMMDGGQIEEHFEGTPFESNPAVVGFSNAQTGDAFCSLRLAYGATGFPHAYRPSGLNLSLNHGGIWQRGAFAAEEGGSVIQPGATLDEYNAYLVFNVTNEGELNQPANWYRQLRHPLHVGASDRLGTGTDFRATSSTGKHAEA